MAIDFSQSLPAGVKVLAAKAQASGIPCCQCSQKAFFHASCVNAHGFVTKKSFCLSHAHQAGLMHPKSWDLLTVTPSKSPAVTEKSCRCGTTESLLQAKGRAGCAHCYRVFAHLFASVVAKVQHAAFHAGKSPSTARPVPNVRRRVAILKMALSRAIQAEAYEQAAQVRNELAQLTK